MILSLSLIHIYAFVPGINDLVYGNEKYGIPSTEQRMELGREALEALEG